MVSRLKAFNRLWCSRTRELLFVPRVKVTIYPMQTMVSNKLRVRYMLCRNFEYFPPYFFSIFSYSPFENILEMQARWIFVRKKILAEKKILLWKIFIIVSTGYPEFFENISKYIRSGSKMDRNNSIRRFILLGDI